MKMTTVAVHDEYAVLNTITVVFSAAYTFQNPFTLKTTGNNSTDTLRPQRCTKNSFA